MPKTGPVRVMAHVHKGDSAIVQHTHDAVVMAFISQEVSPMYPSESRCAMELIYSSFGEDLAMATVDEMSEVASGTKLARGADHYEGWP